MTPDILIAEGRRLARPCVFLRPRAFLRLRGNGPVAAIWHDRDADEIDRTGFRCWITVDARFVPGLPKEISGFLSVYTDEEECEGGRIETNATRPAQPGIELHATEESVLPPIEAIFVRGSAAVAEWLAANNWPRDQRYKGTHGVRTLPSARSRRCIERWQAG